MTERANTAPLDPRAIYEAMSHEQLVARLKVAEDALTIIGWSTTCLGDPAFRESERAKAGEQMWHTWASMVGMDFLDGTRRPDLDALIPQLAATRDRIRSGTLADIEQLLDERKDG